MKYKKIIFVMIAVLTLSFLVTGVSAQSNPVMKVTLSTYDPIPAQPGRLMDLWVSVQNIGDSEAQGVTVEFLDSFPFKLASEADRVTNIKTLGKQSEYLIKYSVKVDDAAPDGTNYLIIKFQASNTMSEASQARLPIDIKSGEVPASITDVQVTPNTLSPGSKGTIVLTVQNLAKSNTLRDLTVTLQLTPIVSTSAILIDLPFIPVGSTTQKKIDTLKPGETNEFQFEIATYPEAKAQLYKLPVTLSFKDNAGNSYNQTTIIGIEVNSAPEIIMSIESTELNSNVKSGNIVFSVINKGVSDVKLATLTLAKSADYEIMSPTNTLYLGKIDSDDFQTAKFIIKTTKDKLNFPITIEYKDSLNKNYKQDFNVEYELKNGDGNSQGGSYWPLIIIVVIIVAAVLLIRRRKKRKQEE